MGPNYYTILQDVKEPKWQSAILLSGRSCHLHAVRRPDKFVPCALHASHSFQAALGLCLWNLFHRDKLWTNISVQLLYIVCGRYAAETWEMAPRFFFFHHYNNASVSLLYMFKNFWPIVPWLFSCILYTPQIQHPTPSLFFLKLRLPLKVRTAMTSAQFKRNCRLNLRTSREYYQKISTVGQLLGLLYQVARGCFERNKME